MVKFDGFVNDKLATGRSYFEKRETEIALGLSGATLTKTLQRAEKAGIIASPKRGFYLIVRPEDRIIGAPDPARWIGPLMAYLGVDYRISLLRAAAFHGASHQAAMIIHVVAPKQLAPIHLGRQQIEFIYQASDAFHQVNKDAFISTFKTDDGFVRVAGIEVMLLDFCRYLTYGGGISAAGQVAFELGGKASVRRLATAAAHFENAAVRRLGYLLERFGHDRQAETLHRYAAKSKSYKLLDPAVKPLLPELGEASSRSQRWHLDLNIDFEIDE